MVDISTYGDVYTRDINFRNGILYNSIASDLDGSRNTGLSFYGLDSANNSSILASFTSSHSGTATDSKGKSILQINNGSGLLINAAEITSEHFNIPYHDRINGLQLGGVNVTSSASELNLLTNKNSNNLITEDAQTISGLKTFNNGIVTNSLTNTGDTSFNNLDITGYATIGTTFDVTGVSTFTGQTVHNGGIDVNGNGDISGTLGVTGVSTFTGQTVHNGGIDVNGNGDISGTFGVTGVSTFTGQTVHNGGIDVNGNGDISGTLGVTGVSTFTGQTVHNGGIDVNGNGDISGTFGVTGVSTFTGQTVHNGGIDVNGDGDISGTLGVTGVSTFTGQTVHNGGIDVNGDGDISGTLGVTGVSTFTGQTVHNGGIDVNGNGDISGTLGVTGVSTFTGQTVHNGGIDVNGDGDISGTLGVTGVSTFTGQTVHNGGIDVNGDGDISGTLGVTGVSTFIGQTVHNNGIDVNGTGDISDTLTCSKASGTGLSVIADASVGGNLTVNGNLLITGSTTTVNTQNLVVADNMVVVNSAPISSKDAGILIERWPEDIVSDTAKYTGTATGGSTTTLVLPVGLVTGNAEGDDYYNSWYIKITNNIPVGLLNVVRKITDYVHSTRTITVDTAYSIAPTSATTFALYNKGQVSMAYDESADEFVFASTASEANTNLNIQEYANVHAGKITAESDIEVAGNLNVTGSVNVDSLDVSQTLKVGDFARIGTFTDVPITSMSVENPALLIEDLDKTATLHLSYRSSSTIPQYTGVGQILFSAQHSNNLISPVVAMKVGVASTYSGTNANNANSNLVFCIQDNSNTNTMTTGNIDRFTISYGEIYSRPKHRFTGGITTDSSAENTINGTTTIKCTATNQTECLYVENNSVLKGTIKCTGEDKVTSGRLLMVSSFPSTANLRMDDQGFIYKQIFATTITNLNTLANIRYYFNSTSTQLAAIANNTTPSSIFVRETTSNTVPANTSIGQINFIGKDTDLYRTGARIEAKSTNEWGHVAPLYSSPTQLDFYVEDNTTNQTISNSRFCIKYNEIIAYQPLLCSAPDTGLSVTANANVGGTLNVTGLVTMNGGVDVNGVGDVSDTLTCSKASGTGLVVTSAATVGGTLEVTGLVTLNGGIDVNGTGDVSDTLTCSKADGTGLAVTSNATVGGTLEVTGLATLNNGINVNGTGDVSDTLTCSKATGTGLDVTANVVVGGTLGVTGVSTFTGETVHNGGIDVNGVGNVSDTLTLSKATGTGLAVTANATVGGNLTVAGDLLINGSTTTINTENLVVSDNMVVVNSAPIESKDGGLLVERWVTDVVSDQAKFIGTATDGTTTTLVLPSGLVVGDNEGDDYYNLWYIKITNDIPSGLLNVSRKITDYVHSTRTVTVDTAFSLAPTSATTFALYNKSCVSVSYRESADEFVFAATASDSNTNLNIQEYVNVRAGTIAAEGDVNIAGDLNVEGSGVFDTLSANDIVVGGTLGVTGVSTFTGQTVHNGGIDVNGVGDVSGTLTLSKATGTGLNVIADATVGGTLGVTGVSTFTGQTVHNGGIDVNGVGNVSDTLTLSKATGTGLNVIADAVVGGTLGVTGVSTFTGQTVHNGGIDVNGVGNVSDTLTLSKATGTGLDVTADAVVGGTFGVTGVSTFTGQTVHNGGIDVNGVGNVSDTLTLSKATGTGLDVTADAVVGGTFGVTGVSTFNGETVHNGGIDINGVGNVSDTLTLSKATGTGLDVTADAVVGGTFGVTGVSTFTGETVHNGGIDINGVGNVSDTLTLSKASGTGLDVTADAVVGGTFGVTGVSTFTGETVHNGGIDVNGVGNVSDTLTLSKATGTGLDVTADAVVGGTFDVTGVSTFTGETVHNGGIDVNGVGNVSDTLTLSKATGTGLDVTADAVVGGTFGVTGVSTFTGETVHNGGIDINGVGNVSDTLTLSKASGTGLDVTADAVVGGTFGVTGVSTFTGETVHNGGININGVGNVSDTLTLSKASGTGLDVTADAVVGGTFGVTGVSTFTGETVHNGGIDVNGVGNVSDTLTLSKATGTGLAVTANATVGGNLTVAGDLLINGSTTTINTENLVISDNMVVVNSAPIESKDGGLLVERWVTDIVSDQAKFTGTATNGTTTTLVLPSGLVVGDNEGDDYYNLWYIKITNDIPSGLLNVSRKITDYVHSTRTVTVDSAFSLAPTSATTFALYNKSCVSVSYRESADEFVFAATASDSNTNLNIQEYVNVRAGTIAAEGDVNIAGDLNVEGSVVFDTLSASGTIYSGKSVVGALNDTTGLTTEMLITSSGVSSSSSIDNTSLSLHFNPTGGSMVASHLASKLDFAGTHNNVSAIGASIVMVPAANWSLTPTNIYRAPSYLSFRCQDSTDANYLSNELFRISTSGIYSSATHNFQSISNANNSCTVNLYGSGEFNVYNASPTFHKNVEIKGVLNLSQNGATCLTMPTGVAYLGATSNGPYPTSTYNVKISHGLTCGKICAGVASGLNTAGGVGNQGDCLNSSIVCLAYNDRIPTMSFALETISTNKHITTDKILGNINFVGSDTTYRTGCRITCKAKNDWNDVNTGENPTTLLFYVEDNTETSTIGTTPRFEISYDEIKASQIMRCTGSSEGVGLEVTNNTTMNGTLSVSGQATFTAQSVHNGGIDVNGTGDVSNTLTCSKADGTGLAVTSNATVGGTLEVTELATLNNGIDVNGTGDVSDTLTCSKSSGTGLDVIADATVGGALGVTGVSTFTGETVHNGGIDVNGVGNVSDTLTLSKATGTGLDVTADAVVGGTFGVTGVSTFTGETVHNSGIDVNGVGDVSDTLTLSKATGTGLNVIADATVGGTFGVTGVSTFTGETVHNGGIDVNGVGNVSDTLTLSKATGTGLNVIADATVGGTLGVTGVSTFTGQTVHNSGIDVNGVGDVSDTLTLSKATGTGLNVIADATVGGTLGVTGVSTFTGETVHNGGIDINGVGNVSDTLTLSKATGTGLNVTANAVVGGTLGVTGVSTFTGQTVHNGGIDVNGVGDVSDTLTLSKATGTGLNVIANATVGGTLGVTGVSTFTGETVHNGGIDINGVGNVSDTLTLSKATGTGLNVTANAVVGGTLGVTGVSTFTGQTVHNGGIDVNGIGNVSDTLTLSKASGTGLNVTANAVVGGNINSAKSFYGNDNTQYSSSNAAAVNLCGFDAAQSTNYFVKYNDENIIGGQAIGSVNFFGYDANVWRKGAAIVVRCNAAWSNVTPNTTKADTKIDFHCEDGLETTNMNTAMMSIRSNETLIANTLNAGKSTGTGLNVTANAVVGGTLGVTGVSTFTQQTVHNGGIDVNGVGDISNTLTLSKATGTGLNVIADATVGGTLNVTGVSTFTQQTVHNGGIDVNGDGDVSGTLTLSKATGTGLNVTADATVGGTLTVTGDFIVSGNSTTINTQTLQVEDHQIEIGKVENPTDDTANGGGIVLKSVVDKSILYNKVNNSWDHSESINVSSGKNYKIGSEVILDNDKLSIGKNSTPYIYLGDSGVNSSWRITTTANGELAFQKKISSQWVTRHLIN